VTLFRSIRDEAGDEFRTVLAIANLGGLVNVLILACLDAGARAPGAGQGRSLAWLLALVAVHASCSRHVRRRLSAWIEAAVHRVRTRVGERVARAEPATFDRVAPADLSELIGESTVRLSTQAAPIAVLAQSTVSLAFVALYAAWLSLTALVLLGGVCLAAAALFLGLRRDLERQQDRTDLLRAAYAARVGALLADRERLRSSRRDGWQARADVAAEAGALRAAEARVNELYGDVSLLGEGALFVLAAAVAYTLHAAGLDASTLAHLFAAVMFVWSPVMGVVGGVAPLLRANTVLGQIEAIERRLADATDGDDPWRGRAGELAVAGSAGDEHGRTFGPLDLVVRAGQAVAITGGDEDGRAATARWLAGLAAPARGMLTVDGVAVEPGNAAAFRELVVGVGAGLPEEVVEIPPRRAAEAAWWLERFGLAARVEAVGEAFTTRALSTGERGRLALIAAMLADRPICVLSGWETDQDPAAREVFVAEVLPRMRAGGKLVLLLGEDAPIVAAADVVVRLDGGTR
jgi:putative pyoverdin transport system ATP-binding/permease protein